LESFEENVEVPLEIIGVGEVESRSEKASEINVQKSSRMYRPALSYLMVVLSIVSLTAGFMFLQKKEKDNLSLLHINSFSHFSREYPKHAKDILKYIKKAKSLGHSDYLIKYNLLNGGWPEHIVSSALEIQEEA
jgi:hypothetical protein